MFLCSLASSYPESFLDTFVGDNGSAYRNNKSMYFDSLERKENPLNLIPDNVIETWCEKNPEDRYPLICYLATPFIESESPVRLDWKPFVYDSMNKVKNLDILLDRLARTKRPHSRSGSRADILDRRSVLFRMLFEHENQEIGVWAKNQYALIQEKIRSEREIETRIVRNQNESFE